MTFNILINFITLSARIQNIVTKLQHLSKIIIVYKLSRYSALMKDTIFDRMNIDTFFEG